MKISQHVKKKINAFAQKSLSKIHAKTMHSTIIGCINNFRRDLFDNDIIIDEIDDSKITHSEKIQIKVKPYFKARNMIKFSSMCFDTEYCYVKNYSAGEGVIFIGHANNIYATQLVFDCFKKIAIELRQAYMPKLKHYKKQSTKDKHADEYIDDWFENLVGEICHHTWYDTPYSKYFLDYVQKHFKTSADERKILLRATEIIKPIYYIEDGSNRTWGEFLKKEIYPKFPKELIKQTMKELDELQTQDVVMFFSADNIDEDDDDEFQ